MIKVDLMTELCIFDTSVILPCLWLFAIAYSIYSITCVVFIHSLRVLLVARDVLRFTGFPNEDFWEINNYSDNKTDQDLTQWEVSGWWDKSLPHRVGGWMEDCK